jgi:hypothetical protein
MKELASGSYFSFMILYVSIISPLILLYAIVGNFSFFNQANSIFSVLRRTFRNLNADIFLPSYKTLVRTHLDYASSVWAPYKKKYIDKIESVQKRATKQIPGNILFVLHFTNFLP